MDGTTRNYEHLERSQRIVRVALSDRLILRSAMGELDEREVENFECFRSQVADGDFLLLERRERGVFKILGIVKGGSVLHEVYEIAFEHGLETGFPEAVECEVDAYRESVDFSGCEDLRHIPFVTVDGAGTRDLDQALYVGRPGDGYCETLPGCAYVVWYAIADASWFVRPGSALYEEAIRRGSSVYFAGMSVPMLPHALSQGIVSLNADVDRRALVFVMQVGGDGVCLGTAIRRGVIHSRAKLVSEDVSAFLADPARHAWAGREYAQSLENFKAVGLLRLQESRRRNVVHFNRVSLYVGLNRARTEFTLGLDERLDVDLYNEQLSLLCNMEGATYLKRQAQDDPEVLAIFRNHEAPSMRDVEEVHRAMCDIARAQDMPPEWYWERSVHSLADFFESLPPESCCGDVDAPESVRKMYRVRQAMERQVLMMQRRSVFSADAGPHSALGVNPYGRFSAPMREIVGIFTHKETVEAAFDCDVMLDRDANRVLRERVIEASNEARRVQNMMDKAIDSCAIAHVVSHDYDLPEEKRPKRRGTILGMKSCALYARLDMPPIELKVYIRDIQEATGKNWVLNEEMTVLSCEDGMSRYVVGGTIELRVSSYEPTRKKWRVVPCV
ncbi:MAG: RNB domain-containing ribonuclease [Proteobacteria bacterium]|nr:RNB domain-containing ribonuclease [Pseudomonadota bacterium]